MVLEELAIQISVALGGSEQAIEDLIEKLRKLGDEGEHSGKKIPDANAAIAASYGMLAAVAGKAFDLILGAIQTGIEASNRYKAAVMGLESVAQAHGIGSAAMEEALASVTDEFFNAAAASTAFKNLLSRGYSLDQATNAIVRLKDAAAFGRQASYGLADAVVSATEGLKNENSVLVDNSGVTKNVAKMWEDYAKARGIATTSLTQAQKIEAEYLGIMEETAAQVGDLEKLSGGLAGAQAEAANQSQLLAQSFGDALTPAVQAGTEWFSELLTMFTGIVENAPGVTAGVTATGVAFAGLITVVNGVLALKKAMDMLAASGIAVKASLGWIGAISAVLGVAVGAYTAYQKSVETAKKAEEDRMQANRDAVAAASDRVAELDRLAARYRELSGKSVLTYQEYEEYESVQNALARSYGLTKEQLDKLVGSTGDYAGALSEVKRAQLEERAKAQTEVAEDTWLATYTKEMTDLLEQHDRLADAVRNFQKVKPEDDVETRSFLNQLRGGEFGGQLLFGDEMTKAVEEYRAQEIARLEAMEAELAKKIPEVAKTLYEKLVEGQYRVEAAFGDWNVGLQNALMQSLTFDTSNLGPQFVDDLYEGFEAALSDSATGDAFDGLTAFKERIFQGIIPTDEDLEKAQAAYAVITAEGGPLMQAITTVGEGAGHAGDELATYLQQVFALILPLNFAGKTTEEWKEILTATAAEAAASTKQLGAFGTQVEKTEKTLAKSQNMTGIAKQWKEAKDALASTTKGTAEWTRAVCQANTAASRFGAGVDEITGSTEDADKAFAVYAANLKAKEASIEADIASLEAQLFGLEEGSIIEGEMTMTAEEAQALIDDLKRQLSGLRGEMKAAGVEPGTGKPKGGGGGSRKKTKAELAEEARRAAEEARQEAIRQDYAMLDHQKHMNQLSLEAELQMLYQIRDAHELNAEEIMEWDRKVYDLRQELRQRDAASIDKAGDALIEALGARYEAMQEAELARLDASRKAWEDWRDDSVKAIQDQIAALDELSKTQDREKQDQEELRKIAKLRQDVEFEQDSYNRLKLQQQLDQAISSREDRLRRLDIQDQKDALNKQIQAIQDQAEAQFAVLDSEQAEIEKAYAERMKSAALQAEAEKLLMAGSQQEIIGLLGEFAPQYDALGKTLGEKLLEGFQSKVGNVVAWFQGLNDSLYQIQAQVAAEAVAAANAFQAGQAQRQSSSAAGAVPPTTVVEQTVNFYEPVESAGQTARRIQQANEELGALLYGG